MTQEQLNDDVYGLIDEANFARRLGQSAEDVSAALAGYPLPALGYRRLRETEKPGFYQGMIDRLRVMQLTQGVQSNPDNWQGEWAKVLDRVRRDGVSLESLRPDYYNFESLRLDQDYVFSDDPAFEQHFYLAVLRCLFARYVPGAARVTDLGCGAGASLYLLAEMFPEIELCGCDWAEPSKEIVALIGAAVGRSIEARNINMNTMAGWGNVPIDGETAVTTLHAMEQLGKNFEPLLDGLMARRPQIVIHLEPLAELYDPENLADKIALTYHRQREYLEGYLPRLHGLQAAGEIEILEERRLFFGSLWHEAYGVLVWRPL